MRPTLFTVMVVFGSVLFSNRVLAQNPRIQLATPVRKLILDNRKEPITLKDFAALVKEYHKVKLTVDEKALGKAYPELFDVMNVQVNLKHIPPGLKLSTVIQLALNQGSYDIVTVVKADSVMIVPGKTPAVTVPFNPFNTDLMTPIRVKALKLTEKSATLQDLADALTVNSKFKTPIFFDMRYWRGADYIGDARIDLSLLRDEKLDKVLQQALDQLRDAYPDATVITEGQGTMPGSIEYFRVLRWKKGK